MARLTPILKFYLPDIDDQNNVYVKGFQDNFNILEDKLKDLLATHFADPTSTDNVEKRAVSDLQMHKMEGHRVSMSDDQTTNPTTYGIYYNLNPHKVTVEQLYVLADDQVGATGRLTSADDIVYNINNNLTIEGSSFRHLIDANKINLSQFTLGSLGDGIEDRLHSDLSFEVLDETDSDTTKNKHLSNAQAKIWQDHVNIVDKNTSNPHNVSAENLKSTENENTGGIAIQQAINSQGSADGIEWSKINKANSNLIEITTRNHSDLQNISELDFSSTDSTKDKHVSNEDINTLYGHQYSKTENESDILDIDGGGTANTTYPTAKINPHEIRAKDLFSEDTATHNHGADTIINEINTNGTSEGITIPNISDKIYWDLIDKNNIDGLGNGANINTIPHRSHQELQEILGVTLTSSDTIQNKHISDSQSKKWEEHVDTTDKSSANPHNVSSQNLKSSTSANTGGVAIQEAINEQATTHGINWSKINKSGSNLTELTTRNHSNLQNIATVNSSDTNTTRDKHISNADAKAWQDHILTVDKTTSNPHNVSAQNLKSSTDAKVGGEAIQEAINTGGVASGINWDKVSKTNSNLTDISIRNHSDLQNIATVNVSDINTTQDKHISNSNAKKWEDHVNLDDGTNIHKIKAENLYNTSGTLTGGQAIVDAINTNGTSDSLHWSKIQKTGSNLTDVDTRNHDDLQNIHVAISSTDGTKNKHVSNLDYKNWEDHRGNANNPHNVTATQIGANDILDTVNGISTTSKLNRNRINYTDSNLTEIEVRLHDDLQNIGEIDLVSVDTTKNKHISNAEGKKWEDHVNLTTDANPHGTKAQNIAIDNIDGIMANDVQLALEQISLKTTLNSAGLLTDTGTYIIDGTGVTFQSDDIAIYATPDFTGTLIKKSIPEKHFIFNDFTDLELNFVYAKYDYALDTIEYLISDDINLINFSNELTCYLVYRDGNSLEILELTDYGNGAIEKRIKKDYEYEHFEVVNGLELKDDSTKDVDGITPIDAHFSLSAGSLWLVLEKFTTKEMSTRTDDLIWYYTETDGSWSHQNITAPIVWQIDTGNGVINPSATDKFVANWIYKDVFTDNWYLILGGMGYSSETNSGLILGYENAQPPINLPGIVKEKSVLVGKVITEKGKTINSAIYRTQGLIFTNTSTGFTPISTHNSLTDIQGGKPGEYYHLTSEQASKINTIESGADKTDNLNVGNAITSTIYGDTGTNGVTITDIYNKAVAGSDNNVKKVGDTMSGTLGIQKENGCALAIGWDNVSESNAGSDTWLRMGNASYAFNHVYKGSESGINNAYELWTTNNNASFTNYQINPNGRVWRINQEGQFNLYKNLISNANIKTLTLNVDDTADIIGQTKIHKGSTDWKDTIIKEDASIELGKTGGGYAGSLKLWASSTDPHYSLIRMHHTDLFLDTAGKYYFNWDYTETPGEFYFGDGAQYNTIEETRANYIVLRSNDKSYFKNGLQVGTTVNSSGYIADFGGHVKMNGYSIRDISSIFFEDNAYIKSSGSDSFIINGSSLGYQSVLIKKYSTSENPSGLTGVIHGTDSDFGLKRRDGKWIVRTNNSESIMSYGDVDMLKVESTGVSIAGEVRATSNIYENYEKLSDRYLRRTAKASNSELLNGISSDRFIYGSGPRKSTKHDDVIKPINDIISSEIGWCRIGTSNLPPNQSYGSLIHMQHDEVSTYASQLFASNNNSVLYMRTRSSNNEWTSWYKMYSDHNKPTKTDVGLSNIPNSISSLINLDDANVLATSKAVKIAYDKAVEALNGSANAENAQKLDNLDSTQFIRSDVDDEATGIVNFSNAMKTGAILLNSVDTSQLVQKGLIIYDHADSHSISVGLTHEGKITLAHSSDGTKTTSNVDTLLLHVGDINSRNLIARENVIFSKSNEKKAEIKYDETTGSLDFIFS